MVKLVCTGLTTIDIIYSIKYHLIDQLFHIISHRQIVLLSLYLDYHPTSAMALYSTYLKDFNKSLGSSTTYSSAVNFLKNKASAWDLEDAKRYVSIGSCKFVFYIY